MQQCESGPHRRESCRNQRMQDRILQSLQARGRIPFRYGRRFMESRSEDRGLTAPDRTRKLSRTCDLVVAPPVCAHSRHN